MEAFASDTDEREEISFRLEAVSTIRFGGVQTLYLKTTKF
jgi:hypothetical protein